MIPTFRAWEKNMNTMIPVENIDFLAKQINTNSVWRMFHEIELMQSTGLKDKNNVEIFEGDIVKVGTLEGEPIGEIKWIPKSAEYRVTNHINPFGEEHVSFYHAKLFEVIGNIHENPELLEVAE